MSDSNVHYFNNFMLPDGRGECVDSGPTVGQVETDIIDNFYTSQCHDGCQYFHACKQYVIQFTNRQFIDHNTGGSVLLVLIQEVENKDNSGFYVMHANQYDHKVLFYSCIEPPTGCLQILHSCIVPLCDSHVAVIFNFEVHTKAILQESKVAYDDFRKECYSQQHYGLSYTEFLQNMIDELIVVQEKLMDTVIRLVMQSNHHIPSGEKLHIVTGFVENQHADDVVLSVSVVQDK